MRGCPRSGRLLPDRPWRALPQALASRHWAASRRLFALPQAHKDAIAMVRSPHFRGYTRLGGELTGGEVDWRASRSIDIGPERNRRPSTG